MSILNSAGGFPHRALKWIDEYSSPRPDTDGHFHGNDLVLSAMHGVDGGYAFMGLPGIGVSTAAAVTSSLVAKKTDSRLATLAAGVVTGSAVALGISTLIGAPLVFAAIGGALVGGVQSMAGDPNSRVRDASGNTTLLTGLFMPGTSKIAAAIGAGISARFQSKWAKAAIGAAISGGIGAALALIGFAPGGILVAAGLSAAAGAIGPFAGPRFAQFFRNLAHDTGSGIVKLLRKAGVSEQKVGADKANELGATPAVFVQQGLLALVNSDMNPLAALVGIGMETAEMLRVFHNSKNDTEHDHDGHDESTAPVVNPSDTVVSK